MPITGGTTSLAAHPRSVLALLVYHYAQGVFASHEIECVLRTDPRLRLLCRDEFPDWRQLRRFRRLNHGVVSNCLAQVLSEESVSAVNSSADAEQRLSEAAVLDELFADE
jgi:transposase